MKISWGHKITGVYLLFVAGMLTLVYRATQEDYDLVTEDYYGAELKYQTIIDQKTRAAQLSAPPQIGVSNVKLQVQLPAEFRGKATEGELYLYCPADDRNDLRRNFNLSEGAFALQLPSTIKGLFEVKLSWQSEGQTYFHEEKVFFQ